MKPSAFYIGGAGPSEAPTEGRWSQWSNHAGFYQCSETLLTGESPSIVSLGASLGHEPLPPRREATDRPIGPVRLCIGVEAGPPKAVALPHRTPLPPFCSDLLLSETTRRRKKSRSPVACDLAKHQPGPISFQSQAMQMQGAAGPQLVCCLALSKWTDGATLFWGNSRNCSTNYTLSKYQGR